MLTSNRCAHAGHALVHGALVVCDRYGTLALVIDCHPRELRGWYLLPSGALAQMPKPFLLRSDNVPVGPHEPRLHGLGARLQTAPGFHHAARPQQSGMVERVVRTLIEQCVHRHRFETLQHACRVIADWLQFYNHRRPLRAMKLNTPAEASL
jgi:putative transposase